MVFVLHPSRLWKMSSAQGILTLRKWWRDLPPLSAMVTEACSYLSLWNMALLCYQKHLPVSTVVYTTTFCAVGGFYITWVHPRALNIRYLHLNLNFWETVTVDLLAHQLPRWLLETRASFPTLLYVPRFVVILYVWRFGIQDILERYDLRLEDCFMILLLTEVLYFLRP